MTLLSGCASALNVLVPKSGYSIHQDIAYGPDPRQKLDIYVPEKLAKPAPVILFFYGGNWSSGSKELYRAGGQAFASAGIVTVVADYRLYPKVKFPAFLQDGAAALRFVHQEIAHYGANPERVFLMGHSAGAYIAVMLAADPSYIRAEGGDVSWIHGAIGVAGPYDFLPLESADLIDIFGGSNRPETQPINYVDGKKPPMLLISGTADETVSPGNSKRMAAKLRAAGGEAKEIYYPGTGHIGVILSLLPVMRGRAALRQDVIDFIKSH